MLRRRIAGGRLAGGLTVYGSGFGVQGLKFRVRSLRFKVWGFATCMAQTAAQSNNPAGRRDKSGVCAQHSLN